MSSENQIHLRGRFDREELLAVAAITPGHLIEITSAGKFQKHSTEGGYAARIFAEISALEGETTANSYAADDLVSANIEMPGNDVQAFLQAGENVSIGDKLISAGDGTLIENGNEGSGVTVNQIVAIAREAKDLSGSGAVDTLMKVMVL